MACNGASAAVLAKKNSRAWWGSIEIQEIIISFSSRLLFNNALSITAAPPGFIWMDIRSDCVLNEENYENQLGRHQFC
jgi:hypothetical protein